MRKSLLADSVLLFVTLVWGIMFVFIKEAVEVMEPMTHLGVRFALAALLLWGVYSAGRHRERVSGLAWKRGAILGFWVALGFIFQTVGVQYTSASKAGFITGLCVVMVPLLGALFFKQKLTRPVLVGLSIALAGLAVLSIRGTEPLQTGDLLVLGCTFCFAIHILLTARYTPHHQPMLLACIQLTVVAFLNLAAGALWEDLGELADPGIWTNTQVLRALIIGAVFASALAYWAQTYFQRFTTPAHTAIIFSSEPVFAAGAAVLLGGETLSLQTVGGGVLILTGILITELKG
ncbi:DMT family transporter [Gorillibacterium sp. sgz5001074]|uniref:DMT family transporter n=1 Tax=Gorillibacterium sp. sgz5001074 TaxID=3446695 RepID=UPI003F665C8C